MKAKLLPLLLLLLAGFSWGCTDVVQITPADGVSQLSVDAAIYNNTDTQTVYLNTTTQLFDNGPFEMFTGAKVSVADDTGNTFTFTETKPGVYTAPFRGKIGRTYYLTVLAQGQTYKARARLPRVPKPDSLVFKINEESSRPGTKKPEEKYELTLWCRDPKGNGDNYRFKIWRNGSEYTDTTNKKNEIKIINDYSINWDGLQFIPPVQINLNGNKRFKDNEDIRIWVMSTDSATYNFLSDCNSERNNSGLFARPPANVRCNITGGGTDVSTKAVGNFGAYGVVEIRTTAPKKIVF